MKSVNLLDFILVHNDWPWLAIFVAYKLVHSHTQSDSIALYWIQSKCIYKLIVLNKLKRVQSMLWIMALLTMWLSGQRKGRIVQANWIHTHTITSNTHECKLDGDESGQRAMWEIVIASKQHKVIKNHFKIRLFNVKRLEMFIQTFLIVILWPGSCATMYVREFVCECECVCAQVWGACDNNAFVWFGF